MIKCVNCRYFSVESCVVDVHWGRLAEAILMPVRGGWLCEDFMRIKIKKLVFGENSMSTEMFT